MKKYLVIIMDLKVWDFFEKLLLCIIRVKFNVSESNKVVIVWKKFIKIMRMIVLVLLIVV